MKAWQVNEFGGLDAMAYTEVATPQPALGEVRVKVHASGMNFAETRMRSGTYSGQQIPFLLGMEMAGVVDAVGEDVSHFAVGDAVFGRARGAHAQYVCVEAAHLFAKPSALSFEQAAAIPVGWLTAWHALRTVAPGAPGDRVLIEAVASSVGSAALQIAKQRGCWVAGTASRDDKLARAAEYGLDAAYNYKRENFAERLLADTDGHGADIGMMTIGEETATQLFDAMGNCGRIVMYGSPGGRQVCFSLNIGTRNIELHSMSISTSPRFMSETMRTFAEEALPLFESGAFRPVLDVVLPIEELRRAHEMIDERTHFGKIVLKVL
jgi:NADPH:quinone reductase